MSLTEQSIANCCLAWVCVIWPGLLFLAGVNIGRHGARGWWRNIVIWIKTHTAEGPGYEH